MSTPVRVVETPLSQIIRSWNKRFGQNLYAIYNTVLTSGVSIRNTVPFWIEHIGIGNDLVQRLSVMDISCSDAWLAIKDSFIARHLLDVPEGASPTVAMVTAFGLQGIHAGAETYFAATLDDPEYAGIIFNKYGTVKQPLYMCMRPRTLERALMLAPGSKGDDARVYFSLVEQAQICQALCIHHRFGRQVAAKAGTLSVEISPLQLSAGGCEQSPPQTAATPEIAAAAYRDANATVCNFRSVELERINSSTYVPRNIGESPSFGVMYMYEQKPPAHTNFRYVFGIFYCESNTELHDLMGDIVCAAPSAMGDREPMIIYAMRVSEFSFEPLGEYLRANRLCIHNPFGEKIDVATFTTRPDCNISTVIARLHKIAVENAF
jgi:hypothetical protein